MKNIIQILVLVMLVLGCGNQVDHENENKHNLVKKEKRKFKWDFDSGKIYSYSFLQETNSIQDWGGITEYIDTSDLVGKGDLKIKSKGNQKADFVLTNLKLNTNANNLNKEIPSQTMVIQDVDANGNFESRNSNSDFLFYLIFPLPSSDLEKGKSERLEVKLPFNLMGSSLFVKGVNELIYLQDVRPDVALIKSKLKVDELNVPKEIKGEFICSFMGDAEYEFDYKRNYFVSAKINLKIQMKTKYESGVDVLGQVDMDMESSNKYEIHFIEFEEE